MARTRPAEPSPIEALLPALRRLDALIEGALDSAGSADRPPDPFRGLYIEEADVRELLTREPMAPLLWAAPAAIVDPAEPLGRLAREYDLTPFDTDVLLLALAPEVDGRYERIFGFLQDDVTRRRPTVGLALDLLCATPAERLARRSRFASGSPLAREWLLDLPDEPEAPEPAWPLRLDRQVSAMLLGDDSIDPRLSGWCTLIQAPAADALCVPSDDVRRVAAIADDCHGTLHLHLHGPGRRAKRALAASLAAHHGCPLLLCRPEAAEHWEERLVRVALREAWRHGAVLLVEDIDALLGNPPHVAHRVVAALLDASGPPAVVLAGQRPLGPAPYEVGEPPEIIEVQVGRPDTRLRAACWRDELARTGAPPPAADLDALAARFRLTADQIVAAASLARGRARWHRAPGTPERRELFAAARDQTGHELARLTTKIEPVYDWGDIVLPEPVLAQLREICERVTHSERVLGEWGFGRIRSARRGISALFSGASGTGKTMAADIVGGELGLDIYKIDLSGVVSKYIGETEKNLDRIFATAEDVDGILFFDEADALFGKRSEVRDAHDRFANIEVSYLLQKMESHAGIAILATNLRANMDDAFLRRLDFVIHFPFPDAEHRLRIWTQAWPSSAPLAADAEFGGLARFALSAANIKNIALAAGFAAAADGGEIRMEHLLHATRREYAKLGKRVADKTLAGADERAAVDAGAEA